MRKKNKLKFYIGLKRVGPQVLLIRLDQKTTRQKVIFYNVLKGDLNEEQRSILLADLQLDPGTLLEAEKELEEFRYVLVGNIIGNHYHGEEREIKSGTKQFRAGTKVYLLPKYGGNGHIHIPVYGLPRKSDRKVLIVIRREMLKNIRVKKTFDRKLIKLIDDNFYYDNFDNNLEELEILANIMNENQRNNSIEINNPENSSQ